VAAVIFLVVYQQIENNVLPAVDPPIPVNLNRSGSSCRAHRSQCSACRGARRHPMAGIVQVVLQRVVESVAGEAVTPVPPGVCPEERWNLWNPLPE